MRILFDEHQIATGVSKLAARIAEARPVPQIAVPILAGAFVFAADLLRALSRNGLSLSLEFIWLRSYAAERKASSGITVLAGPSAAVRDCHILLVDGVLDHGRTLVKARELLLAQGAASVRTAVLVDKRRDDAELAADYAVFSSVDGFIVGYGMDDAGKDRGLPFIGRID